MSERCIGNRNLCGEPTIDGTYCEKHDPKRWTTELVSAGDGPKSSSMTYRVFYCGRRTNLLLVRCSNGKKRGYRLTEERMVAEGGDEIDLLKSKGVDRRAWLESQLDKPEHASWATQENKE